MFKTVFKKAKNPIWVGVFILFIAVTIIVFSSIILYNRTVELLTQNLRERILTISITAAASIDPAHLRELVVESDWQKPEWARVVNKLNKIKYSNDDVVFMYIFRKTVADSSMMEFVADADSINPYANTGFDSSQFIDVNRDGVVEPDGPDKLQWPGQPYPEAVDIPEAFEAYNGALTSADIYTDEYGSVITGYAPITDENGNVVAILATDVKADDFFTITTQTLRPFLIFIVFLTLIISILTVIIIYVWRRYTKFLEKINYAKTEFVSLASHQLRAPLTAIKGYISLIYEGDYGPLSPEMREPVKRILTSTQSLIQIVGDFLDVSRIELGTMKYTVKPFDLRKLVEQIVGELKPTIEDTGLQFEFKATEDYFPLDGDETKLKQVIGNLIDNSLKYTKKGFIHVTLEKKKDTYLLSIKDSGVGISEAVMPKLFVKFVRAGNANEANVIGTGLGLYVAKEMIGKHKGRIWAESEGEGKGATFFVELPHKS